MKYFDENTGLFIADSSEDPLKGIDVSFDAIQGALSGYILSVSGWRTVFAPGGEEDHSNCIKDEDAVLAAAAAEAFFRYLGKRKARIIIGSDARPTGRILTSIAVRIMIALGADVSLLGIASAPEIMAFSNAGYDGFLYISASHNPIGHNGFKFGIDGCVLPGAEAEKVKRLFLEAVGQDGLAERMGKLSSSITEDDYQRVLSRHGSVKKDALRYYEDFVMKTAHADEDFTMPFGIVIDFNGSARSSSIDIPFLRKHGCGIWEMNGIPGQIAHGIVPEGENLETARAVLEDIHAKDPSFILGYMPDNDGDRGNFVYIADNGNAEILSSLLVDDIASRIGVEVFRSDIGEANVVSLAENLRSRGYIVPVCGEGSNGGIIAYPSKVRDPMNSIMTISKLWSVPGVYGNLMKALGREEGDGVSIDRLVSAFPRYHMTPSFSKAAAMKIRSRDFDALKAEYEKILSSEISRNMASGAVSYEIKQYEGANEYTGMGPEHRPYPSSGGYKVQFIDGEGEAIAYLWLSRSRTEPVCRIMVNVKGSGIGEHDRLLSWQRSMVERADARAEKLQS